MRGLANFSKSTQWEDNGNDVIATWCISRAHSMCPVWNFQIDVDSQSQQICRRFSCCFSWLISDGSGCLGGFPTDAGRPPFYHKFGNGGKSVPRVVLGLRPMAVEGSCDSRWRANRWCRKPRPLHLHPIAKRRWRLIHKQAAPVIDTNSVNCWQSESLACFK